MRLKNASASGVKAASKETAQGLVDILLDVEKRLDADLKAVDRKASDRMAEAGSAVLKMSSLMEVSSATATSHLRSFLKDQI